MKRGFVALSAVLAAVALPAAAHAGRSGVSGVVVAKQAQRGTFVVGRRGVVQTAHGRLSRVHLGDRVRAAGLRLADGTLRASTTQVVGHVRSATVRGVVISRNAERTLVAAGRSVIAIQRRAARRAPAAVGLRSGSIACFGVSISGAGMRETSATAVGTTSTVEVEGTVVTLSPFVVDVEGLPVTIAMHAGVTLPASLSVGDEVELTVTVDANDAFTLVSVESSDAGDPGESRDDQAGSGQSGDHQSAGDQSARSGDDQSAGSDDNSQGDDDQGDESGGGGGDGGPGGGSGGDGGGAGGDG